MQMTTERKIIVVLAAIILAGAGFAGLQILKAHDANLVATTQQKADDAQKAAVDKAIVDRDVLLQGYQKQIAAQQVAVKTSTQAVQVIEHYVPMPAAQQPVIVQKADLTPIEQAKLPDAPSYVITTQDQAIDTAKVLLQCDADTKSMSTCKADLKDTQAKESLAEQDAAMWQKSAKGGSKWARIWNATKYGLIGGAIGVGVGYVAHR